MDAVLAFVPEEERIQYSAMTGQSLYYMGEMDLKHKVLAIVEEEGASKAAYALKLLQSEGVLSIASTGKDPTMGWTQTVYDTLNRPVCVITFGQSGDPGPAGVPCSATGTTGVTQYSYSSNSTTITDQAGVSRTTSVDGLGRMTGVLENGIGASTAYGYDVQGNLLSVEQGAQLRSFGYTSLGRLASAINPESGTTGYTYFDDGNLKTKTDARGITSTMAYDGLNRITSKTYSDGTPSVSYTYDTNETIPNASAANFIVGHLAQVSTTSGGTAYVNTYRYDAVGRATASMQTIGTSNYPFLYTYLPAGMQTESYPSGRVVTNQFDSAGRVSQVADASTTFASAVTYAPQGAVASLNMGSGITETTSFNTRLQPWQIQAGSLLTLTYGYGTSSDNGNVYSAGISRNGSTWIQTYSYDGANRLTGASETGPGTAWNETYGFDGYGNQWLSGYSGLWTGAVTSETPQSSAWYDTSTNRISNSGSWTYDTAGNIKTVGGMSRSFTYDPEERQTQAVVNGTTENYVYDGEGRRVAKSTSAGTTTYIYDADGQLAMEFPSGSVPTGTSYLTADVLGSTRLVTGTTTECEDYLPFGLQIQSGTDGRADGCFSAADVVPEKKFTSKERDVNTGLDYFGARYFSGAEGRFTGVDPKQEPHDISDPQGWNKYVYTRNSPLRYVDPDGQDWLDLLSGAANAFGSDNMYGAGRASGGNGDYKTGQAVGDFVASVVGTGEALIGGGEALVTAPAAVTIVGAALPVAGAAVAVQGATTVAIAGSHLAAAAFADNNQSSGSSQPERTASDPLRRDENGKAVPDPEAAGAAHTQLGTRQSKSQPGTGYKQAREFDSNGKPLRDVDFTNHGRSDHPDPHQHTYDPHTGKRGSKEPLQEGE